MKAGYLLGSSHWAVKVASGFAENPERGLPASDGLVIAFDADSGAPVALLLDHGYITDARTGAAGGVAARHLAPTEVTTVAVIGTGAQAGYQLDGLAVVRPHFREVRVWGRDSARAERRIADLASRPGLPVECRYHRAQSVEAAVRGADLIITCTASRGPLIRNEWIAGNRGCHITAVGSDGEGKQELDPVLLTRARLVVDSRNQCARRGELQHAVAAGLLTPGLVAELGEVVMGRRPGRQSDQELTICDLTGLGAQDVAAAGLVLAHASRPR